MSGRNGTFIGAEIDVIMVQVSFSNANLIPACAYELPAERLIDHAARMINTSQTNNQVIDADFNRLVCLEGFARQAIDVGFGQATVAHQQRIDKARVDRTYHMVRFTFRRGAPGEFAVETVEAFDHMAALSFWHIRGYIGKNDRGTLLSINGEAREQRYEKDDLVLPRQVRTIGSDGRKTAERQPIKAHAQLSIIDRTLILEPLT